MNGTSRQFCRKITIATITFSLFISSFAGLSAASENPIEEGFSIPDTDNLDYTQICEDYINYHYPDKYIVRPRYHMTEPDGETGFSYTVYVADLYPSEFPSGDPVTVSINHNNNNIEFGKFQIDEDKEFYLDNLPYEFKKLSKDFRVYLASKVGNLADIDMASLPDDKFDVSYKIALSADKTSNDIIQKKDIDFADKWVVGEYCYYNASLSVSEILSLNDVPHVKSLGEQIHSHLTPQIFQSVPYIGVHAVQSGGFEDLGAYKGRYRVVGVLDSGMGLTEAAVSFPPSIEGSYIPNTQSYRGVVSRQDFVFSNPDDSVGHGTHIAGIISSNGLEEDGSGVSQTANIGIAPECQIVSAKVTSTISVGSYEDLSWNIMDGVNWLLPGHTSGLVDPNTQSSYGNVNSVDIMQMSVGKIHEDGGAIINDGESFIPLFLDYTIDNSERTVVVAAGNNGPEGGSLPPGGYDDGRVVIPADAYNVITVGATEGYWSSEKWADYSSYDVDGNRQSIDIVAPGTDIYSCNYDFKGLPEGDDDDLTDDSLIFSVDGGIEWIKADGTSFAAPHVSGVATLVHEGLQRNAIDCTPSPLLVKAAVLNGARKIDNWEATPVGSLDKTGPLDVELGTGSVDALNSMYTVEEYRVTSRTFSSSSASHYYHFDITEEEIPYDFTATLTWNREIDKTSPGDADNLPTYESKELSNFDMYLFKVNPGSTHNKKYSSIDTDNNVEHIYTTITQPGLYAIEIRPTGVLRQEEVGFAFSHPKFHDGAEIIPPNLDPANDIKPTIHFNEPLITPSPDGSNNWYITNPTTWTIDADFEQNGAFELDHATYQIHYGEGGKSDLVSIFSRDDVKDSYYGDDADETWSISYDVLKQGYNYVEIKVYTTTGLSEYSFISDIIIRLDESNPTKPVLIQPSNNGIVSDGTPFLDWSSTDDGSGIQTYELEVFDGIGTNYHWTTAFDFYSCPALAEKDWFWKVRAKDFAGHYGAWSDVWKFTYDKTFEFDIQINSGATFSTSNYVNVGINLLSAPTPTQMRFRVNQGSTTWHTTNMPSYIFSPHSVPNNYDNTWIIKDPGASSLQISFMNMKIEPGDYVRIYDSLGFPNTPTQTYTDVEFGKSFGSTGQYSNTISGDTAYIRLITDSTTESWGFEIDRYKFYSSWESWQVYSASSSKLLSSQGINSLNCQLRSSVDNIIGTNMDQIFVDTYAPTVSFVIDGDGSIFLGTDTLFYNSATPTNFNVKLTASDTGSGILKAVGSNVLGDSPIDTTPETGFYQFDLPYSIETGETYSGTIYIYVYDLAGNCQIESFNIELDNVGPFTSLVFPPDNYFISTQTPTFSWISNDASSGLSDEYNIQISRNDIFTDIVIDSSFSGNSFTSPVALDDNVQYYWWVMATDNMNNLGPFSPPNAFTVDVSAPNVVITSPNSGDIISGSIDVHGDVNDINLNYYSLRYKSASMSDWALISEGNSNIAGLISSWSTTYVVNDNYDLRLAAIDKAGNMDADIISLSINNNPEILDLEVHEVFPGMIRFSYFLNSDQTVSAYINEPGVGLVRTLLVNYPISGGWHSPGLYWDFKDDFGNDVASGDYELVFSSLESSNDATVSFTLFPPPVISLIAGAGSLNPTIQWTNPFGTAGIKYVLNTGHETYQTSTTLHFNTPGQKTITVYGIDEANNAISKVGSFIYDVPSATIFGTISAPFAWTGDKGVTISASHDALPQYTGWTPVGAGSTYTTTGSYSMSVAAGYLRIMATHNIDGYSWAPYNYAFVQVNPGTTHQFNFEIVERTYPGSGGCPYVFVWNGTDYDLDNNIIPTSEIINPEEYKVRDLYVLEKEPVVNNSQYQIAVAEWEDEYNIFDSFELLLVDHDSSNNISIDNNGDIRTYKNAQSPISCYDKDGNDYLYEIATFDDPYYDGYVNNWLEISFGNISSDYAKLILRSDLKPGTGGPIDPRSIEDPGPIVVQVVDRWGQITNVSEICPRDKWSIDMVDLSPFIDYNSVLNIRLVWLAHHHLTYVALDTTEDSEFDVHESELLLSEHSTLGDVTQIVKNLDANYVELVPSNHILLNFSYIEQTKEARELILVSNGYYCNKNNRPTADFRILPEIGRTYENIYFDGSDSFADNTPIEGYLFEFGDGTNSGWLEEPFTYHEYEDDGDYFVTLFVKDNSIPPRIDIHTESVKILNSEPVPVIEIYQEVEISFSIRGAKGNTVYLVVLEDGSEIHNTSLTSKRWPVFDSISLEKYIDREYEIVLYYDAARRGSNTVWVFSQSGRFFDCYHHVFITRDGYLQEISLGSSLIDSVLRFNTKYVFDASESYDIDGEVISYDWNFGDGYIDEGLVVEHKFREAGTYTVFLTVIDDDGAVATVAKEVLVDKFTRKR